MYAMDHTMHFEHRSDERRSRWTTRTGDERTTAVAPTPAPQPDLDTNPTHQFLD